MAMPYGGSYLDTLTLWGMTAFSNPTWGEVIGVNLSF
jgi:hypothetical protein